MATFLSFILGGAVAWAIAGPVLDPLSGLFAGAIAGAVIGLVQWLALRSLLPASMGAKWAAATTLGISIGVADGAASVSYRTGGVDLAVIGFVTGISVGALTYTKRMSTYDYCPPNELGHKAHIGLPSLGR